MRSFVLLVTVLELCACQGDPLVSQDLFQFERLAAEKNFCTADTELSYTLVGTRVGSETDPSTKAGVKSFTLDTALSCSGGEPTSITITPHKTVDMSGDADTQINLTFAEGGYQMEQLQQDPAVVYQGQREITYYGHFYHAGSSAWQMKIVLRKKLNNDGTLDSNFRIDPLVMLNIPYDGSDKKATLQLWQKR